MELPSRNYPCLYITGNEFRSKIGRSFDLSTRIKTYPKNLQLYYKGPLTNIYIAEKELIKYFSNKYQIAQGYEWFNIPYEKGLITFNEFLKFSEQNIEDFKNIVKNYIQSNDIYNFDLFTNYLSINRISFPYLNWEKIPALWFDITGNDLKESNSFKNKTIGAVSKLKSIRIRVNDKPHYRNKTL